MKVIFLDFDGVLNSRGSDLYEKRFRKRFPEMGEGRPLDEILCQVCTSNFQVVLDHFPHAKVVISSTWRNGHSLDWLKQKLSQYGVDSSCVIGITPGNDWKPRGMEINEWLAEHPEVKEYVVIDDYIVDGRGDNVIKGYVPAEHIVETDYVVGFTLEDALKAIDRLGGRKDPTQLGLDYNVDYWTKWRLKDEKK